MDALRVNRTLINKQFGIFRYSAELEKYGIANPSEQIVAVGRFVEQSLGRMTNLPRLGDEKAVERWMENAIASAIPELRGSQPILESLECVILRTGHYVAWNPYKDLVELLNFRSGPKAYGQALNHLQMRGFRIGLAQLSNLTQQFLLTRLPDAVRSFDPLRGAGHEEAWLTKVFYRFALKEILSDNINRTHLETFESATSIDTSPDKILDKTERLRSFSSLPEALAKLPHQEQLALELYFGFRGREYTQAEIGQELSCSEYLSRSTIVHGLSRLVAHLGVRGPFEEEELNLIRLVFGDGMELKSAAKRLGYTEKRARYIVGRIRNKIRDGLRPRTFVAPTDLQKVKKEEAMPTETVLERRQIIHELRSLRKLPRLIPGRQGKLLVQLGSAWIPVAHVRRVVFEEGIFQKLQEHGAPIEWIGTPDPTLERADLPEDALSWAAELQDLGNRSWVVAEALYEKHKETAEERKVPFSTDNRLEVVERIQRTLVGVAQAIESVLPRRLRRRGEALLCIDFSTDEERPMAYWEEDSENQKFDLTQLVQDQALLYGELPPEMSEILSEVLIQDIFEGDTTLPGFRRHAESTRNKKWLEWIVPSSS
jgi:RNA polymerase sigma factor (sigma-70 family)